MMDQCNSFIPLEGDNETASQQPFEASGWLADFREVGGWWIVDAVSTLWIGWLIVGFDREQNEKARSMWREITGQRECLKAVRDFLMASGDTIADDELATAGAAALPIRGSWLRLP